MAIENNNENEQYYVNDSEYITNFSHETFKTITNGVVLVRINKFNGKITVDDKPGLKISFNPFVAQKTYTTLPQKLNTPPADAYTADGNGSRIHYDTDYMYVISDPKKFATIELNEESKNVRRSTMDIVGERLDNIVRGYVSRNKLNDFIGKGNIDILNDPICESDLDKIDTDYGIRVTEMLITKIELPKEIADQLDKNKISELKKVEAENAKQVEITKAEGDAEARKINAKADAVAKEYNATAEATRLSKIIKEALVATQAANGDVKYMCDSIGQMIVNEGLVNGSNPNTVVLATNAANSALQQSVTSNGLDLNVMIPTLMAAMHKINNIQNSNSNNQQPVSNNVPQNNPSQNDLTSFDEVDWERYLEDKDYADKIDGVSKKR